MFVIAIEAATANPRSLPQREILGIDVANPVQVVIDVPLTPGEI
jgi:hypothetical protein